MIAAGSSAFACSANNSGSEFTGSGGSGATGAGTSQGTGNGDPGTGGSTSSFNPTANGGSNPTGGTMCNNPADLDGDGDGFTGAEGDCNDCDANTNPGAIEVLVTEPDMNGEVPAPSDEDCNNQIDDVAMPCDGNIGLTDTDPMNGAKAIGLCQKASPSDKKWGVLSAAYVGANGSPGSNPQMIGIQPNFGSAVKVREGANMLMLSSGYSRQPGQPGECASNTCSAKGGGTAPPGFPQDGANCQGGTDINDDIALELKIRSPKNATGYSFNFDFYSFEYPEWVCTTFNDQFIALVNPPPNGAKDGNISFDAQKNPVSVNIAFFQVCSGCPLGTAELAGTGFDGAWFDDAGATSWLKTQAPVTGGDEFTIRFAIWDTGDTAWDSSVLIDGWEWIANGGTVSVGTIPDPPK